MAAGIRKDWEYLTNMGVIEFLNYLAYLTDKSKREEQIRKEHERKK